MNKNKVNKELSIGNCRVIISPEKHQIKTFLKDGSVIVQSISEEEISLLKTPSKANTVFKEILTHSPIIEIDIDVLLSPNKETVSLWSKWIEVHSKLEDDSEILPEVKQIGNDSVTLDLVKTIKDTKASLAKLNERFVELMLKEIA